MKNWSHKNDTTNHSHEELNEGANSTTYTIEEELYRLQTGVYRSREVPYGFFRCPCCGELYPIDSHPIIKNAYTQTNVVGRRIKQQTTSYNVSICSSCYKYKAAEEKIMLITIFGSLIVSLIVMCCIDSFDTIAIVILFLPALMACCFLGLIIGYLYKIIIQIAYKKDLFISFQKSAEYGALRPIK